jgi:hypothetical protein
LRDRARCDKIKQNERDNRGHHLSCSLPMGNNHGQHLSRLLYPNRFFL